MAKARHLALVDRTPADTTTEPTLIQDPSQMSETELIAQLGEAAAKEIMRLRAQRDDLRKKAWANATVDRYSYWMDRFSKWCTDPSQRWNRLGDFVFPALPTSPGVVELFFSDWVQGPEEDHPDFDAWDPPAPATVEAVWNAIRWHHSQAGEDLEANADLRSTMRGIKRVWVEGGGAVTRAQPLVVEEVRRIGRWLIDNRHPVSARRDRCVVALYGAGLGLTEIGRLRWDQVTIDAERQSVFLPGIGEVKSRTVPHDVYQALVEWRMAPANGTDYVFSAPTRPGPSSRQHIRSVLLRMAAAAGLTGWRTGDQCPDHELGAMAMIAAGQVDTLAVRDHALILLAFGLGLRRSEICELQIGDVEIRDSGLVVMIRRSKTDQEGKGCKLGFPRFADETLDAVKAVTVWLSLLKDLGSVNNEAPLFRPVDRLGRVTASSAKSEGLTAGSISKILRKRVVDAQIVTSEEEAEKYTSHSPRRGLATSLAEAGLDAPEIARQTRHQSYKNVQTYVDDARSVDSEHNPLTSLAG